MEMTKLKTRKMIDLYTKGKRLGEGSFGVIFLCTEIATGQHYACKCIQKCTLISQRQYKMAQREVDILKLIVLKQHPNIVAIKDVLEDDIHIYMVMELCGGGTLHDHLDECGIVKEPRAAQMIKEIVCAIEACHSCGIVHRDVKLENLMLQTKDKDSTLKLIDFGLAQFFEQGKILTDIVGSPMFVAPEVLEGHYGPKVDIWSVGVVLYSLFLGDVPFHGSTLDETYEYIIKRNDLFKKDPWLDVSEGAKDLIKKMMNRNANERFSASEVLKHPWILEYAN